MDYSIFVNILNWPKLTWIPVLISGVVGFLGAYIIFRITQSKEHKDKKAKEFNLLFVICTEMRRNINRIFIFIRKKQGIHTINLRQIVLVEDAKNNLLPEFVKLTSKSSILPYISKFYNNCNLILTCQYIVIKLCESIEQDISLSDTKTPALLKAKQDKVQNSFKIAQKLCLTYYEGMYKEYCQIYNTLVTLSKEISGITIPNFLKPPPQESISKVNEMKSKMNSNSIEISNS
ncbi:MAG: hypothetical protein WC614_12425 [bacterium]